MMKRFITLFCNIGILFSSNSFAQNGIDSSFGNNGIVKHVLTRTYAGSKFTPTRLQKDAENRLYAFGNDTINGVSSYCVSRWSASGQLDSAFGNKGFLFYPTLGTGICLPPLLQADGKFIYTGYQTLNGKKTFVVTRFLPNGNRDSSFAINGQGIYVATFFDDIPIDNALQNDGKILILSNDLLNKDFLTMRITTNGRIDSSFNGTGLVKTNLYSNENARRILVQSDGKILVAGNTTAASTKLGLVRYLANGNLDSTFGTNGVLVQSISNGNDGFTDFCLGNDGKITALAGSSVVPNNGVLVQWNSNGSLNNNFGVNGLRNIGNTAAIQILTDSTGVFYVRGNSSVRKYFANGNLDSSFGASGIYDFTAHTGGTAKTMINLIGNGIRMLGSISNLGLTNLILSAADLAGSFGTNGFVNASIGSTNSTEKYILKVLASLGLPDGSLIVAVQTEFYSKVTLSILKFLPSGVKDMSFGNMGVYVPEFTNNPTAFACKLILTSDQTITVAANGSSGTNPTLRQVKLFKLETNGQLLTTFGDSGFVTLLNPNYDPIKLAVQSSGKIILGLKSLQRYHTNGTLDTTFSSSFPHENKVIKIVFVLKNDKIIIGNDSGLFRLHANGTFDPTFGENGYFIQTRTNNIPFPPFERNEYIPVSIAYEKPGFNLLVSYAKAYYYGGNGQNFNSYNRSEWMRITEDGSKLNTIYLTDDSSFLQPSQTAIDGLFYLIKDTRSKSNQLWRIKKHASIIKKVSSTGVIDNSFNGNGNLYGETGIWNGANPVVYLDYESIEPLSETKFWYVRNANDTIYLSYIQQPKVYLTKVTANKQYIGFGDTVKFSATAFQPFLNYHWRFSTDVRYLNGTDSNSANPMVQFLHAGSFDVSLEADFGDTTITETNKNYIVLNPFMAFSIDKPLIYVNDTLSFNPSYYGYPISYLWEITPNTFSYLPGMDESTKTPVIVLNAKGKYTVRLTISYVDTIMRLYQADYFEVLSPVGLNSLDQTNLVKLFPNPASNYLNLQMTQLAANAEIKVSLYNVLGQEIKHELFKYNGQGFGLNLTDLTAGVYVIKVEAQGKVFTRNFIKQ
jgi:uncharacterized delta-60 repeat protein